jgi:hypothetical protein
LKLASLSKADSGVFPSLTSFAAAVLHKLCQQLWLHLLVLWLLLQVALLCHLYLCSQCLLPCVPRATSNQAGTIPRSFAKPATKAAAAADSDEMILPPLHLQILALVSYMRKIETQSGRHLQGHYATHWSKLDAAAAEHYYDRSNRVCKGLVPLESMSTEGKGRPR